MWLGRTPPRAPFRRARPVSRFDDEQDWVGTPPEGRHSRDRADPQFWWRQRPLSIAAALAVVLLVVVILVLLL